MLTCPGHSHGLTIILGHIPFIKGGIVFIPVFEFRQFHRIEDGTEKHAGVASVAGSFVNDGYLLLSLRMMFIGMFGKKLLSFLRISFKKFHCVMLAWNHSGCAAVTMFYSFEKLHNIMPPIVIFCARWRFIIYIISISHIILLFKK